MSPKSPTTTKDREKYAIWIDKHVLAALRAIQENDGVPVSEMIRRAINKFLEGRKK